MREKPNRRNFLLASAAAAKALLLFLCRWCGVTQE